MTVSRPSWKYAMARRAIVRQAKQGKVNLNMPNQKKRAITSVAIGGTICDVPSHA